MDAQTALTPESFSIIAVFLRADIVVKVVLLGLFAASLWSWTVIIDKLVRFAALNRQADRFEREVASGRSLEDVAQDAGPDPRQALPRMLQAALRDWREGAKSGGETATALLLQRIDRALDSIIAREGARVEDGLGSLAIVATSSPFIGLFGTVWGIMHAFQAIALEKNTNLAVVAPSIAEALFATAVGLAAAIPAYIAYNKFSTDAGKFTSRLEGFADELSAAVSRRLAERMRS
ncbi:MAG TPA: protein TolQ [Caulobacteraceae bacterium]|jgi:biopolymer transport protein TolQ|nr:protein TolQ [Caulobacteraceae bacterium]